MSPPHLVEKWARETFLTIPGVRVFVIDDMRNGGNPREPHGVNEVRLRRGEIGREGLHTSLSEMRRLGRKGWRRDTGCPIEADGTRLTVLDFDKKRLHEVVEGQKGGMTRYSALWQADRTRILRMAPAEYMGRYMPEWWDYAIADEIHQLAG